MKRPREYRARQRFGVGLYVFDYALPKIIQSLAFEPPVLVELLKAYDAIGRAYIESLPLEMAVIAICG